MIGPPERRARVAPLSRAALAVYTVVLVAGTHWPRLVIEVEGIDRPDLLLHVSAFGLWTVLAIRARLFGPMLSGPAVVKTTALALAFATVDELTQALPGLGRTVSAEDWSANLAGVFGVGSAALLLGAIEPSAGEPAGGARRA